LEVTPLLAALIDALVTPGADLEDDRHEQIVALMLGELASRR